MVRLHTLSALFLFHCVCVFVCVCCCCLYCEVFYFIILRQNVALHFVFLWNYLCLMSSLAWAKCVLNWFRIVNHVSQTPGIVMVDFITACCFIALRSPPFIIIILKLSFIVIQKQHNNNKTHIRIVFSI